MKIPQSTGYCDDCGREPTDKRKKPLEWIPKRKEWLCVICIAKEKQAKEAAAKRN